MDHAILKARQREIRDSFPEGLGLRVHRALSWLDRAEREADDDDARFIFLWIAFNAAYANEIHDRHLFSEKALLGHFLARLVDSDTERLLYRIVWDQFPGAIRLLIDNPYVFGPFWDFQRGEIGEADYRNRFTASRNAAMAAIGRMNTTRVLTVVFDRLYTLRNQLVHGGATWNGSVNRSQVRDGSRIMGHLVPTIILLMMNNPNALWGDAAYPVVRPA